MIEASAADPNVPAPATLDELIADAVAVGLTDFSERSARDWHRRGLLGSPARQSLGRNHGSAPGVYSSQQRSLFQAIARHRAAGIKVATLATLPVWAWLNDGEACVDLIQLRRALITAIGNPQRSERVAGQTAQLLLGMVDFKQGRPGDRGKLRNELISQLSRTRIDESSLLPMVQAVFGSSPLTVRGPVGASMTAADFTYMLRMVVLAAGEIRKEERRWQESKQERRRRGNGDGSLTTHVTPFVTDEQLLTVRRQYLATWPVYQQQREELATHAGSLAPLFADHGISQEVTSSVTRVLLSLGMQLDACRVAATRRTP